METIKQLRAEDRIPTVKHFISLEGPAGDFLCNKDLVSQKAEEPDVVISEDDPYIVFYPAEPPAFQGRRIHPQAQNGELQAHNAWRWPWRPEAGIWS
jgi:hypothetical protein